MPQDAGGGSVLIDLRAAGTRPGPRGQWEREGRPVAAVLRVVPNPAPRLAVGSHLAFARPLLLGREELGPQAGGGHCNTVGAGGGPAMTRQRLPGQTECTRSRWLGAGDPLGPQAGLGRRRLCRCPSCCPAGVAERGPHGWQGAVDDAGRDSLGVEAQPCPAPRESCGPRPQGPQGPRQPRPGSRRIASAAPLTAGQRSFICSDPFGPQGT